MAKRSMGPLIGALFTSVTPPSEDKKRAKKSKGEKSVTEPRQQHGELANSAQPTWPKIEKPSDKALIKERAKSEMRNATESWVSGHMDTKEHTAIHARAHHVLHGKPVHEFKGKTGDRKVKWK